MPGNLKTDRVNGQVVDASDLNSIASDTNAAWAKANAVRLADLKDVTLTGITNGMVLAWDSTQLLFKPVVMSGGGGGGAVSSVAGRTGAVTLSKSDINGLDQVTNTSDADKSISNATAIALSNKADLVGGKIPTTQLPSLAITEYLGQVASNAAMTALTGQRGDFVSRTDSTVMSDGLPAIGDWILTADAPSSLSSWHRILTPGGTSGGVTSVAGKTGPAVTLVPADVGLGNVTNVAPADLPISTLVQQALNARASLNADNTFAGVNTFTASPIVPSPTTANQAANRAFVLANVGTGGGGTGPFGTLVYCIPASDLTAWPAGGTDTQKMAAINANDARIVHEMVTRPGYHIETDPGSWWPVSLSIDEFVGTYTKPDGTTGNFVEGADYSLGGRFYQCRGTRTRSDIVESGVIIPGAVLAVTRKSAQNGLVVTPNNLRTVQLGGTPNLGSYFTAVCSGFDITSNMAFYKAGGLGDLVSANDYGYSQRAGYGDGTAGSGVYKGAFFPIAGLSVNVTGYSLTALNTALGTGNTVSSIERRTIVGGTSGATAVVQGGDFGANGQILVNSVTGNFSGTEAIKDQATGATVATYSSTTVLMRGLLNCAYDITPQFRFLTNSRLSIGKMMMRTEGASDIDDVIENYNRPDGVFLTGCTNVDVDGLRILNGYSTGLSLRSCYNTNGLVHVSDLPNHALEALSERAYGYAVRWLGHSQNGRVGLDVQRVRHGTTSNAIRGTWNLNARTGSATGATSLCTNFWNHGPGMRNITLYGKVENTWSACWDFHEGAERVLLDHPIAIQPVGSGRSTTSPDGFSIRGFDITVIGAYSDGCRIGIYDLAGPLDSGGLAYTNTYIGGVHLRTQAGGYNQSEDTFDESLARFEVLNNVFRCDPAAGGAYAQQFGALLRKGNVKVTGNVFSGFNYAGIRLTSYVGSAGSNATGHVEIRNNDFDWTDSAGASRPVSVEATFDDLYVDDHIRANPVAGTQKPLYRIVNSGGNSNIRYGPGTTSFLSTTHTAPQPYTSTGGAPTWTAVGATGGGGGTTTPPDGNSAVKPQVGQIAISRGVTASTPTALPVTTAGRSTYFPQDLQAATYDAIVMAVSTTAMSTDGAGVSVKFAIYGDDGTGAWPKTAGGPLAVIDATVNVQTTGTKTLTFATPWVCPADGTYWLASFFGWTTAPTTPPTLQCIGSASFSLSQTPATFPNKPKGYERTGTTDFPSDASTTSNLVGVTANTIPTLALRRSA